MAAAEAYVPACSCRPGDRIGGKYVLDRMIGAGGMCTVWLATHAGLDRRVALKFARTDLPAKEMGRLLREAQATARLEHPSIVKVFDYGETDAGCPFIVMELLEGASLADCLERNGPLSPVTACRLLLPVIDALALSHDSGIVHRDLKPANIFLAREWGRIQPKLLDFGIAKLRTGDPQPRLTMDGAVLGSPSYMAPEQARGQNDVDHRADVWAACMVLYEAVAGATPIRGDNYNALLRSIVEDDIPPMLERGNGEAALWAVLSRGLVKDRRRRFQSARELGVALCRFLLDQGVLEDASGAPIAPKWNLDEAARRIDPPLWSAPANDRDAGLPQLPAKTDATTRRPGLAFAVPPPTRARRWSKRGLWILAAALVAAAVALALPEQTVDSLTGARAVAENVRKRFADLVLALSGPTGGVEMATRTRAEPEASAPVNTIAAAVDGTPTVAPALAPPPGAAAKSTTPRSSTPRQRRTVRIDDLPAPEPAANPESGAGHRNQEQATADETLRELGLKAPYR